MQERGDLGANSIPEIIVQVPENNSASGLRPGNDDTLSRDRSNSNLTAIEGQTGRDRAMSGSTMAPSSPQDDLWKEKRSSSCGTSGIYSVSELEEALRPDPGSEGDFEVKHNPFDFSPGDRKSVV